MSHAADRILITGGAGFIGSHMAEAFIGRGSRVTILDNLDDFYDPSRKRANLKEVSRQGNFEFVEGDIRDRDRVRELFEGSGFNGVIHLAAKAGVRPSILDPELYASVNTLGTSVLLEAAATNGVERFILASSSSVYGNNEKVPFHEDDAVDHPISPYAATKKACELLAHSCSHLTGMPVTCLRFFTVYGPRQRPEMAIHRFADLISREQPIPVFGDGSTLRDYTFVDDIVQGVLGAWERCAGYRIYNLGESRTTSLTQLVEILEKSLGKKAVIDRQPLQPGDVHTTYADVTRAREELGYAPEIDVEQGIARFVKWFREGRA